MTVRRKRLVLMPNTEKNIDPSWLNALVHHLHVLGCELRSPESSRQMFADAAKWVEFTDDKDVLYARADLLLVFGGDGSIIRAARSSAGREIPIAGINCGRLGYLADLEQNETDLLDAIIAGEGIIERRIMLDAQILREDTIIGVDTPALNDIVLTNGPLPKLLSFGLYCNGELVEQCYADGMILAAPTGSTAYSMSAGGPIVEPDAENIIISPICAHMMSARSFVLGPNSLICIDAHKLHDRHAILSIDGNTVMDISNGDTIIVKRSDCYTLMADLGLRNFYEFTFEKLR